MAKNSDLGYHFHFNFCCFPFLRYLVVPVPRVVLRIPVVVGADVGHPLRVDESPVVGQSLISISFTLFGLPDLSIASQNGTMICVDSGNCMNTVTGKIGSGLWIFFEWTPKVGWVDRGLGAVSGSGSGAGSVSSVATVLAGFW